MTDLPAELGNLVELSELDLTNNRFIELPGVVCALRNLRTLSPARNRLTDLPPGIGQLTNLRELRLHNNRLNALPPELASLLRRGLRITLEGNPLPHPYPDIIARGSDALAVYLESLIDSVPSYEAKVLLVGEGNVGKTSLVAALRGEKFVENRDTTHGIEIHQLLLRHPGDDVDMTVRAWDFGGQEVYRITHQFFFSRRAVYLVVWKTREGQEQNEVEGWLWRIRLRVAGEARVIVVATHADERRPELDVPHLRRALPGLLAGHHAIDNRSGCGIAALRTGIAREVAALPHMGQLLSAKWIAARDEVLASAARRPQIPYRMFADVCRRHGMLPPEITTLAELLHD